MSSDYYDRDGNLVGYEGYRALCDLAAARGDDYRRVDNTVILHDVHVSTVHLGLDHAWGDNTPPLIFESMVFGGNLDQACERYTTEAQAREGHAELVKRVLEEHKEFAALLERSDFMAALGLVSEVLDEHKEKWNIYDDLFSKAREAATP